MARKMNKLKRLRVKALWSQEELGAKADVNPGTISAIENNKHGVRETTLQALADALTDRFRDLGKDIVVELEDLLDESETSNPPKKAKEPKASVELQGQLVETAF